MGGNVGINKASPSRYLEIGGTSNNPQIRLSNGSGTSSLEVLGNAASGQEIRFGTEASPQAGRIIYHNNDNSLSYSNTGGERLRVTTDGKIGINDATPVTKLVVRDTLQTTANNHYSFIVKGDDNGTNGESAYIFLSAIDASTRGVAIGAELQSSSNDHDLIFKTSDTSATPTEKVRITNTGKVGIGSDNPQSMFEVYGSSPIVRSKHKTSQKYTQINHNGTDGYLDWSSGGLLLRGASNDVRLRIDANGDITTSGSITTQTSNIFYENNRRVLEVNGGTTQGWLAVGATRTDTDAYVGGINFVNRHGQTDAHRFLGYIRLKSTHVNTGQYGTNVLKGQLEFATKSPAAGISSTTPDMVISPTGEVGINETSPQQQLHVHDDTNAYHGIFVNGNAAPRVNFARDTTTTAEWSVGIDGTNGNNFAIAQGSVILQN